MPSLYLEALNLSVQKLCRMYRADELARVSLSGGVLPGRMSQWLEGGINFQTLEANARGTKLPQKAVSLLLHV